MTEKTPKKPRRKRRSKAEIEAEKAAKAAAAAEALEMEEKGFERVRARDEAGHFIKDDPATPENEAWEWQKKEEEKEEECIPCQEDAAKALEAAEAAIVEEPVKEEPVVSAKPTVTNDYVPMTGLAKIKARLAQRQLKEDTKK